MSNYWTPWWKNKILWLATLWFVDRKTQDKDICYKIEIDREWFRKGFWRA